MTYISHSRRPLPWLGQRLRNFRGNGQILLELLYSIAAQLIMIIRDGCYQSMPSQDKDHIRGYNELHACSSNTHESDTQGLVRLFGSPANQQHKTLFMCAPCTADNVSSISLNVCQQHHELELSICSHLLLVHSTSSYLH